MNNAIEICKLEKNFIGFGLKSISLDVPLGSVVGFIGANGSGKSTTINIILNELCKDSGCINLFSKDHLEYEIDSKSRIGVVHDKCFFPEIFNITDIDNIMKKIYANWNTEVYLKYIEQFKLPSDKKIQTFSKGMKVKLQFAIALSHCPDLLIMDEATSGLDPIIRDEILDILDDFKNDNKSIFMSSHIISDIEKIADYIVFVHEGDIIFNQKKEFLKKEYIILNINDDFDNFIPKEDVVAEYINKHNVKRMLVLSKSCAVEHIADSIKETPTLEDVMLFLIKGRKSEC